MLACKVKGLESLEISGFTREGQCNLTESLHGCHYPSHNCLILRATFMKQYLWFAVVSWTSLQKSANLGHSNFPGNSRESLRISGKFPFPGNPKIREN